MRQGNQRTNPKTQRFGYKDNKENLNTLQEHFFNYLSSQKKDQYNDSSIQNNESSILNSRSGDKSLIASSNKSSSQKFRKSLKQGNQGSFLNNSVYNSKNVPCFSRNVGNQQQELKNFVKKQINKNGPTIVQTYLDKVSYKQQKTDNLNKVSTSAIQSSFNAHLKQKNAQINTKKQTQNDFQPQFSKSSSQCTRHQHLSVVSQNLQELIQNPLQSSQITEESKILDDSNLEYSPNVPQQVREQERDSLEDDRTSYQDAHSQRITHQQLTSQYTRGQSMSQESRRHRQFVSTLSSQQNYLLQSPSQGTNEDDCVYTHTSNNSAIKSMLNTQEMKFYQDQEGYLHIQKQNTFNGEENLSSNVLDEQFNQFEQDNDPQELKSYASTSSILQNYEAIDQRIKEGTQSSLSGAHHVDQLQTLSEEEDQYVISSEYPSHATPSMQHQFVQKSKDSSSKAEETPQVMQLIEDSQASLRKNYEDEEAVDQREQTPEVIGSRQQRRLMKQQQEDEEEESGQIHNRNSSRYMFFKDISPLVKSTNTLAFDNIANQTHSNNETVMGGKISPPFLNKYTSVLTNNPNHQYGLTLPNMQSPESKLPNSILESPPLMTETSPDNGIKDFSRQYLNQGMWPSKDNHEVLSSVRGDRSIFGSDDKRVKNSISFSHQQFNPRGTTQCTTIKMLDTKRQSNEQVLNKQLTTAKLYSTIQKTDILSQSVPHFNNNDGNNVVKSQDSNTLQYYFKRPSEQFGLGNDKNSSITQLKQQKQFVRQSQNIYYANGQGLGSVFVAEQKVQNSFDDLCNIHGGQGSTSQLQQDTTTHTKIGNPNRLSNGSFMTCKNCLFEKEKRQVTQKAFERALGISLYLIEEIDKIQGRDQPLNKRMSYDPLNVRREDILSLLQISDQYTQQQEVIQANPNNKIGQGYHSPQYHFSKSPSNETRFNRSKSQSTVPLEIIALQKSLQIPRGGFQHPNFFNNCTGKE